LYSACRHLNPGGLFIADFWYGPAVLGERPAERVKIIAEPPDRLIRLAQPKICTESNLVEVSYTLLRLHGQQLIEETREVHPMRYFFLPEMDMALSHAGLKLLHACPFLNLDEPLSEQHWNCSIISQRIDFGVAA
jgi:hypothetical protein